MMMKDKEAISVIIHSTHDDNLGTFHARVQYPFLVKWTLNGNMRKIVALAQKKKKKTMHLNKELNDLAQRKQLKRAMSTFSKGERKEIVDVHS